LGRAHEVAFLADEFVIQARRWLRRSTQNQSRWSGTRIPSPKRERGGGGPRWLFNSPTTLTPRTLVRFRLAFVSSPSRLVVPLADASG
jgi:hypothetical protein